MNALLLFDCLSGKLKACFKFIMLYHHRSCFFVVILQNIIQS